MKGAQVPSHLGQAPRDPLSVRLSNIFERTCHLGYEDFMELLLGHLLANNLNDHGRRVEHRLMYSLLLHLNHLDLVLQTARQFLDPLQQVDAQLPLWGIHHSF